MSDGSVALGFEHGAGFVAGEVSGGFGLGPLETQYEELFAEALADGVITPDEHAPRKGGRQPGPRSAAPAALGASHGPLLPDSQPCADRRAL